MKKKKLILFLFTVWLCSSLTLKAFEKEPDYNKQIEICFQSIYNLSFSEVDSCINNSNEIPLCYKQFLLLNLNWWKLVTSNEPQYITEGFVCIIKGLDLLEKSKLDENEKTFLKICFESFRLRLLLYNQQFWRSYTQSKAMNKLIAPTQENEKTFTSFYLTSGLYNYFAFVARKKYPFLFNDKNYKKASKEIGIEYLKECTNSSNKMLQNESLYFLMKLYLEIENEPEKAMEYSSQLIKNNCNNLIYHYYHLNILLNLKRYKPAKEEYSKIIKLAENITLSPNQKKHIIDITNKIYKKDKGNF
jgi:hypothetical protein